MTPFGVKGGAPPPSVPPGRPDPPGVPGQCGKDFAQALAVLPLIVALRLRRRGYFRGRESP